MCADEQDRESFEETLRSIASEISKSAERMAREIDVDEIAGSFGVDPDKARSWVESAGSWLSDQVEKAADAGEAFRPSGESAAARSEPASREDPLKHAGPHPLDVPTDEQGLALCALDSGRWSVEPTSNTLAAHGEGPGPSDALGLVRELRVRDWIAVDGALTLAGRHALSRWLASAPTH